MTDGTGTDQVDRALTLAGVAERADGRVEGDPDRRVVDVVPVAEAGPGELGLLAERRYLRRAAEGEAGALLVSEDLSSEIEHPSDRVIVDDPHRALLTLLDHFHPPREPEPGIHPTAVLGRRVQIGREVTIGPYAVVEEGARIGDRARIGAHCVIGRDSVVGEGSVLHPHVVLYAESTLGRRVTLHSGVRVGVDGFGYVLVDGEHRKVPQVGGCVLGDDVEVGANTCIDRGSVGRTEVGAGTKIDNLVQLGHNVRVGERSVLVAQVGVSGSTRIGNGVALGGQAGIGGHSEIGDRARIGGQAGVLGDVPADETWSGYPARPHGEAMRAAALGRRLPELFRRLRALERKLGDE